MISPRAFRGPVPKAAVGFSCFPCSCLSRRREFYLCVKTSACLGFSRRSGHVFQEARTLLAPGLRGPARALRGRAGGVRPLGMGVLPRFGPAAATLIQGSAHVARVRAPSPTPSRARLVSCFGLACLFTGSPPFTLVSGPRPDPEKLGGGLDVLGGVSCTCSASSHSPVS